MKNAPNIDPSAEMQLALSDICPDSIFGAIPVAEQLETLMTYRAVHEDVLAEVPQAYAAYLEDQRNQWG
tara:strand:+ start:32 stop:238 length:207 start_codon:yes stop_codon:yes gene_type:complete